MGLFLETEYPQGTAWRELQQCFFSPVFKAFNIGHFRYISITWLQGFQGNFSVWWCSLCFLVSFGNWETKETLFCRPEAPYPCYNIDISNVAKSCALTTKYTSVGCFHWKEGLPTERIYPWFLGEQNSHYFRQWHLTLCELSIAKNSWMRVATNVISFYFLYILYIIGQ